MGKFRTSSALLFALAASSGTGDAQQVSAIASPDPNAPTVLLRKQEVLLTPFPVGMVKYTDAAGVEKTVAWSTLSGKEQRAQLPNEDLFIEIRRVKQDGTISILPAKVTAGRAEYQFLYRWMKYRTEYCSPANQQAGYMRVGVGLDIKVDVSTRKAGLNVSGLGPLMASAEDDRFRGSLNISTVGLGTNSGALAGFLGNAGISEHAAAEADKAIAVVKAVIENNETLLTPHQLAVIERTSGACSGDVAPAAVPTTKQTAALESR